MRGGGGYLFACFAGERSTLLRRARTFLRRSTRATDANTDAFSGVRGGNAGFVISGKRGKQKMDARLRTSIIITQIKRFAKKFSAKTGGAISVSGFGAVAPKRLLK